MNINLSLIHLDASFPHPNQRRRLKSGNFDASFDGFNIFVDGSSADTHSGIGVCIFHGPSTKDNMIFESSMSLSPLFDAPSVKLKAFLLELVLSNNFLFMLLYKLLLTALPFSHNRNQQKISVKSFSTHI